MDFSSGEFWKGPFFLFFLLDEYGENHGFQLHLPFGPGQQKFNFEMKTYAEHWLLSRTLKWIIKMDSCQLEDWQDIWRSSCDFSSVCRLDNCMNLHFSTQQSLVISLRVNNCLSCLTLYDWHARLARLLIKVADEAITIFDILGMHCTSHLQEWSLHKHKLDCVAYTFHHP